MRLTYRQRPSAGFVLLVVLIAGVFVCFAWALRTPPLERVWRLDAELALGDRPALLPGERRLFQATVARHPAIGASLIEDRPRGVFSANEDGRIDGDYAYLLRLTADDPGELEVLYAGARRDGGVRIRVRTHTAGQRGVARTEAPWRWRLPDDGPFPQLVEVLLEAGPDEAEGSRQHHPVRVRLRRAP